MARVWLGETIKISNSERGTYLDCRRRWYLTYYRELELRRQDREVTGPRSLGTRMHLALEGLYTRQENPVEILREIYEMETGRLEEAQRAADADLVRKEYDLAHAMLTGYLDWAQETGVDDGYELVGSEEVVEVDSHIENVKLRGKMDQRVVRKVDGARLFRDFKTVGDLTTPMKTLPLDEQMLFYQLLETIQAKEATGGEPQWRTDGGLYLMLRKVKRTANAKPPFYGQLEVQHNQHEIRNMWTRVARVVEEIVSAREALDAGQDHHWVVPPRPNRDCSWKCSFFPICGMMDDGSDYESMIGEYYEHQDPHERYTEREEPKGDGQHL